MKNNFGNEKLVEAFPAKIPSKPQTFEFNFQKILEKVLKLNFQ
jgi:hypothetical protein